MGISHSHLLPTKKSMMTLSNPCRMAMYLIFILLLSCIHNYCRGRPFFRTSATQSRCTSTKCMIYIQNICSLQKSFSLQHHLSFIKQQSIVLNSCHIITILHHNHYAIAHHIHQSVKHHICLVLYIKCPLAFY